MREIQLPERAGVSLKPQHYEVVVDTHPDIGWFEVHAENYMGAGGAPHYYLERIRRDYPLSLHGVGLSIGSDGPLDKNHLRRLRALNERYEPEIFSEHLAWSGHDGVYLADLLPVPYTPEAIDKVSDHVDQVQGILGRRILLENPSTYVTYESSSMPETEFLGAVAARTGCGLLLDVNNVFVSASNQGYAAQDYIDAFPIERVEEIHLAGHAPDSDGDNSQRLLIDAHDRAVDDAVWQLYALTLEKTGVVPTLIEWDNNLPAWSTLMDEARRADTLLLDADRGRDRAVAG